MPVTAKLSRKFYEKFGDEITNELVDWFNKVDATYRSELKELNELNFARFDAKLEQRIAEVKGDLRAALAGLEARLIKWMFLFWVGQAVTTVAAPVSRSCWNRTSLIREPGSSSLSAKSRPPPAPQQYGLPRLRTGSLRSAPNLVSRARGSSTFPPYRAR